MYPDRIVIGAESEKSRQIMETLYSPFQKKLDRVRFVGLKDAEMIKYASNAMLAMKISFINEIAVMSDYYGVDIENVRKGIGADPKNRVIFYISWLRHSRRFLFPKRYHSDGKNGKRCWLGL